VSPRDILDARTVPTLPFSVLCATSRLRVLLGGLIGDDSRSNLLWRASGVGHRFDCGGKGHGGGNCRLSLFVKMYAYLLTPVK
jgi:hypothetical protein